jgi:hypothetical protein
MIIAGIDLFGLTNGINVGHGNKARPLSAGCHGVV